jgi:hypothetical protein
MRRFIVVAAVLVMLPVAGCRQAKEAAREQYYTALEKVGLEKREVLVKRVDNAREAQQKAEKQFRDALEEFKALVDYRGGELESRYEKLRGEYEDAKQRADTVHDKIRAVKNVATALFKEWETEIGKYTNAEMKRVSQRELAETRTRYEQLVVVMERAASRMDPVLAKLQDQVLFLKHNLNAKVLGSLQTTAVSLQTDVDALIRDMEASIREADAFIKDMEGAAK